MAAGPCVLQFDRWVWRIAVQMLIDEGDRHASKPKPEDYHSQWLLDLASCSLTGGSDGSRCRCSSMKVIAMRRNLSLRIIICNK